MRIFAMAVMVAMLTTGLGAIQPVQAIVPVEICGGIEIDEVMAGIATASIDFIWFTASGSAPNVPSLGPLQLSCTFADYDLLFPAIPEVNVPLPCYLGEGTQSDADMEWNRQEIESLNFPGCDEVGENAPAEIDLAPFLGCLPDSCAPPLPCADVPTCADYLDLPCDSVESCAEQVPPLPCDSFETCADYIGLPCNTVPTCLELIPDPPCDDTESCADYLGLPCKSLETCEDLLPPPPCDPNENCLGECDGGHCETTECVVTEIQKVLDPTRDDVGDCVEEICIADPCDNDDDVILASRPSNFVVEVTVTWPAHDDPQYTEHACHKEAMEAALDALASRTGWTTKLNCGFSPATSRWSPEPGGCHGETCWYDTVEMWHECRAWFLQEAGGVPVANDGQIGFCWAKSGSNNGAGDFGIGIGVDVPVFLNHPDPALALHEILHVLGADHYPDDTWRKNLCRQLHYHGNWKWHVHEYRSVMNYCHLSHGKMDIDQNAYNAII